MVYSQLEIIKLYLIILMAKFKNLFVKNYITFSDSESKVLFKKKFLKKHYIYKKFGEGKIYTYDVNFCNFRKVLSNILKEKIPCLKNINDLHNNLEFLHLYIPKKLQSLEKASETNQVTRMLYETNKDFTKIYYNFIKKVIKVRVNDEIYFQKTPTIRFQFPKQKTFNWNPSIHSDIMLGHPIEEVNIWVPITDVFPNNSMVISSLKDSLAAVKKFDFDFNLFGSQIANNKTLFRYYYKKCKPLSMRHNSYLVFDPRRLHATQKNNSNKTRISMDIRIISKKLMDNLDNYVGTGRRKIRFVPGEFYSLRPY